mmetsp:Transcript_24132/g.37057  ORF Transcript_24132/g.37057 Transcript_24132/m.37057 type:complete len:487 (-) Transcript_24132:3-1463(-)
MDRASSLDNSFVEGLHSLFDKFQFYIFICLIAYNFQPTLLTLYLCILVAAGMYLVNLISLIFHGTRPYWIDPDILANSYCHNSYSLPSIECFMISLVSTALYLAQYYEVGKKPVKYSSVMCTGYLIKMGISCLIGFLFIFAAAVELNTGASSSAQIMLGGIMGVGIAMYAHFKFRISFKLIPAKFALADDSDKIYQVNLTTYTISMLGFLAMPIFLSIFLWNLQVNKLAHKGREMEDYQAWLPSSTTNKTLLEIVKESCYGEMIEVKEDYEDEQKELNFNQMFLVLLSDSFFNYHFQQCAYLAFGIGSFIGQLLMMEKPTGLRNRDWNHTSLDKSFVRLGLIFVIYLTVEWIITALRTHEVAPKNLQSLVLPDFWVLLIGNFVLGIFFFGGFKRVLLRFAPSLINPKAIGQEHVEVNRLCKVKQEQEQKALDGMNEQKKYLKQNMQYTEYGEDEEGVGVGTSEGYQMGQNQSTNSMRSIELSGVNE